MKDLAPSKPSQKQGQVLAYIYHYTKINRRPPAEADIGAFFGTTGPSTHQMIIRLENGGFIARTPGAARSIEVLLPLSDLPALE